MPLQSKLFTIPPDPQLQACLTSDASHITPGASGDHVKKIQIALNELSDGRVFLIIDGKYGPKTAAAVRDYKNAPSRNILGPGQKTADDIVGKRTIQSLDDEMTIFENEDHGEPSLLVSTTSKGAPHDHTKCPGRPLVSSPGRDLRAQHRGTPINPVEGGRRVNIGGEFETQYLNFEDFVTDGPPVNNIMIFAGALIRPLTQTLPSRSVSNLCMRATPITHARMNEGDGQGEREISRITRPGCRFTFATNQGFFEGARPFLLSLGTLIEDITVFDTENPDDKTGLRVVVIIMRGDGRFTSQKP